MHAMAPHFLTHYSSESWLSVAIDPHVFTWFTVWVCVSSSVFDIFLVGLTPQWERQSPFTVECVRCFWKWHLNTWKSLIDPVCLKYLMSESKSFFNVIFVWMRVMRFSQRCWWRCESSGIRHGVVWYVCLMPGYWRLDGLVTAILNVLWGCYSRRLTYDNDRLSVLQVRSIIRLSV